VFDHHIAHAGTSDGRCSWPTVIPAFGQSDGGAPADRFRRTGFMEYPVLVTRSVDLGARELDHLRPFLGAAKPPPIGSARIANTIGIVRVSRARAPITGVVTPKSRRVAYRPALLLRSQSYPPAYSSCSQRAISPPMTPPTIGATQNSQSDPSATPPPKMAVAVERAGFTDALSTGMATR